MVTLRSLHAGPASSAPCLDSSSAHSIGQPRPRAPAVPADGLRLGAPKAPCPTVVNHIRKALEEGCWAAGLSLLIRGLWLDCRPGAVGNPETRLRRDSRGRYQQPRVGRGLTNEFVPLSSPPNPSRERTAPPDPAPQSISSATSSSSENESLTN